MYGCAPLTAAEPSQTPHPSRKMTKCDLREQEKFLSPVHGFSSRRAVALFSVYGNNYRKAALTTLEWGFVQSAMT